MCVLLYCVYVYCMRTLRVLGAICDVRVSTYVECNAWNSFYNQTKLFRSICKRICYRGINYKYLSKLPKSKRCQSSYNKSLKYVCREHAGGMKYARKNFKHYFDVNVHHGRIVGVLGGITTQYVQWLRQVTFGTSLTRNGAASSNNTNISKQN